MATPTAKSLSGSYFSGSDGRPLISNIQMIGGLYTDGDGSFLSLPITGAANSAPIKRADDGGGGDLMATGHQSFLSASFVNASGSVIQALNFLKSRIDADAGGDVSGPATNTNHAIARFNGANSKAIEGTGIIIDDSDNITAVASLSLDNGGAIGIAADSDLMTLTNGVLTVAGEVSMTTLDIGGTNVTATATELNYNDLTTLGTAETSKVVTVSAADKITLGAVEIEGSDFDINGGAIDGTVIGASSAAAGTFAALVGTSLNVSDGNITNVADIALDSISADDGSSFSFGSNWTAASRTCADLGTVTTADINGGTIDGATIATSDITVGASKTLNVSDGTLTTSQAQKLAIVQGVGANTDIGDFDFRAQTLTADGLTNGSMVFAGSNGVLSDDAGFTYSSGTNTLTIPGGITGSAGFSALGLTTSGVNAQMVTNKSFNSGSGDATVADAVSLIISGTVSQETGVALEDGGVKGINQSVQMLTLNQIPHMAIMGADEDGKLAQYRVQVSGGILQLNKVNGATTVLGG
jgi:hypothetical protein